jgi:hypothetical protein
MTKKLSNQNNQEIYQMHLDGKSYTQITRELLAKGILITASRVGQIIQKMNAEIKKEIMKNNERI